jgi:hypothetical protein
MAIEAYAVMEKGTLLADTVCAKPDDARHAATIRNGRQGVNWKALEGSGCTLVRVSIQFVGKGERPQERRQYLEPEPQYLHKERRRAQSQIP